MKGLSYEYPMYFGATPDVFKKAKELRKLETDAERILWSKLSRNQILGLQFRRQHPLNRFIADFYCPKLKLVIEVDGNIHDIPDNVEYDKVRSEIMSEFGINVIRFTNDQIMNNIDDVINKIENLINKMQVQK